MKIVQSLVLKNNCRLVCKASKTLVAMYPKMEKTSIGIVKIILKTNSVCPTWCWAIVHAIAVPLSINKQSPEDLTSRISSLYIVIWVFVLGQVTTNRSFVHSRDIAGFTSAVSWVYLVFHLRPYSRDNLPSGMAPKVE